MESINVNEMSMEELRIYNDSLRDNLNKAFHENTILKNEILKFGGRNKYLEELVFKLKDRVMILEDKHFKSNV